MIKEDKLSELDQLNCQAQNFIAIHEWAQELLADSGSALSASTAVYRILTQSTPVWEAEIRNMGDLPSTPDQEPRELEQLIIYVSSALNEEQESVVVNHLQSGLEKLSSQLDVVRQYHYGTEAMQSLLTLHEALAADCH